MIFFVISSNFVVLCKKNPVTPIYHYFLTFFYCTDGNGFKTSTMRLGADAVVFTRAIRGRFLRNLELIFCRIHGTSESIL